MRLSHGSRHIKFEFVYLVGIKWIYLIGRLICEPEVLGRSWGWRDINSEVLASI